MSIEIDGSIIDNRDCTAEINRIYPSQIEAEEALAYFVKKARSTESEPCIISSEIKAVDGGFELIASFTFQYQAETMIFQLATR
ncbi:hypothetical protein BMT54_09740 [Pasteurellaceae bacterium 15-036681]|nr:hypothetical protein BMT54_09740 [Pasteurellaceae bacterium 15-036681]